MLTDALILVCALGWLTGSGLTAIVASEKGRHGGLWGLGAFFLFSPLLALIALAALPALPRETQDYDDPGSANMEPTSSPGEPADLTPWIIVALVIAAIVAVGVWGPRLMR
jgi:hypothetical protein